MKFLKAYDGEEALKVLKDQGRPSGDRRYDAKT